MNVLVPATMFGWFPVVLLLFSWLSPRRAILVSFFAGWLFLPPTEFQLPGLPDYSKMLVVCGNIYAGIALFDFQRLRSLRFRWFDLPMIAWCLCPFLSSIMNDQSAYDGLSWVWNHVVAWGMPYVIGRLYFFDVDGMRELAIGVVVSGLVYIPFCLFEARMSPQLCRMVYGFSPRSWAGTRLGGWRPNVFLEHGLALGMWMTTTSLVCIWLWSCGTIKKLGGFRVGWTVLALLATTFLCRSTAALGLLMAGLACLYASRWLWTSLPAIALILLPPVYCYVRATNQWDGQRAVELAEKFISPQRAQSLSYRFKNEDRLAEKALEQPAFGWARWGRSRVFDERGRDVSVTDGRWIITFGQNGVVGLVALMAVFILPPLWFCRRYRPKDWSARDLAPAAVLMVTVPLFNVDNLLNAMSNPLLPMALGALNGFIAFVQPAGKPETVANSQRKLWPPVELQKTT